MAIAIAPGSKIKPEWNADSPRIFWMYNGKIISIPIIARLDTLDKMAARLNSPYLKTEISRNGTSILSWRQPNKITKIIPTKINASTSGSVQPSLPALENP